MAIHIATDKQALTSMLNSSSPKCKSATYKEVKIVDLETSKRYYENKIEELKEDMNIIRDELVYKTELTEKIQAEADKLELLRWLYKEQAND